MSAPVVAGTTTAADPSVAARWSAAGAEALHPHLGGLDADGEQQGVPSADDIAAEFEKFLADREKKDEE